MAKLHFNYGAMNGGKSTRLIQTAFNYREIGRDVVIAKPGVDTKGEQMVVSRAGGLSVAVDLMLDPDMDLLEEIRQRQIGNGALAAVLIDEAQFMTVPQVDEAYGITTELDVPVIAYGLRRDFRDIGFPAASRLLELADELEEIPTMCSQGCGKKGRHNLRKVNGVFVFEGAQVEIDDQDDIEYVSLCKCCAHDVRTMHS